MRVLIADDDVVLRHSLRSPLKRYRTGHFASLAKRHGH